MTEQELFELACHSYHRWCKQYGAAAQHPAGEHSSVDGENGRVVLRNASGVLARYIYRDGKLERWLGVRK